MEHQWIGTKCSSIFQWEDAPQQISKAGAQATRLSLMRKRKKKTSSPESKLYICKWYKTAGIPPKSKNGAKYIFGEWKTLSSVNHPHIVRYEDFSYKPGGPQIARLYMEYCEGGDLTQFEHRSTDRDDRLTDYQAAQVLMQLAQALLFIHHGVYKDQNLLSLAKLSAKSEAPSVQSPQNPQSWKPILHRDVKPANIFIALKTADTICVKLGDFGIAKFETDATDTYIGSQEFLAPEQRHASPEPRRTTLKSDIYALGVTLRKVIRLSSDTSTPESPLMACLRNLLSDSCCLNQLDTERPTSAKIIDRLRPFTESCRDTMLSETVQKVLLWKSEGTPSRKKRLRSELTMAVDLCERLLAADSEPKECVNELSILERVDKNTQSDLGYSGTSSATKNQPREIKSLATQRLANLLRTRGGVQKGLSTAVQDDGTFQVELFNDESKVIPAGLGTMEERSQQSPEARFDAPPRNPRVMSPAHGSVSSPASLSRVFNSFKITSHNESPEDGDFSRGRSPRRFAACAHLNRPTSPETLTSSWALRNQLNIDGEATQCTQNTQGVADPRRMGRNTSGLSETDIADVMCILHPCSPAACRIVARTAERALFNVLQDNGIHRFEDDLTPSELEKQETFILPNEASHQTSMDLALRFSAPMRNPQLGFVFGRNPDACDIVLSTDTCKRSSNVHFSIYVNGCGVILLQDMSTNGTIVDEKVLKGKTQAGGAQTRMLSSGSIIQILSRKMDEIVKFIVRIPNREGHLEDYRAHFDAHMKHVQMDAAKSKERGLLERRQTAANLITQKGTSLSSQLMHNTHGMHWSGGEHYNVVGLVGKGAFATIYQLATKSEGHLYAAKELEKRRFMKNGVIDRLLDNEMEIMKAITHRNIVKYIDYVDQPRHMYIIMEFVPCGDLVQYLDIYGALAEDLAKQMAKQVLGALTYLHKKKITHRDIKPDNILLANLDPANFTVKLSDFGLSKAVKDDETFLKTFCGTLLYCAPEVFPHYNTRITSKGKRRSRESTSQNATKTYHGYSQTVDIWSFGATLWSALCLRPPFEGVADNTGRGMFNRITMTPLDTTDLKKQEVSVDAIALLIEMLNTNPATRPSPAQCLRHKWFGSTDQLFGGAEKDDVLVSVAEEAEYQLDFATLSLNERNSSQDSR